MSLKPATVPVKKPSMPTTAAAKQVEALLRLDVLSKIWDVEISQSADFVNVLLSWHSRNDWFKLPSRVVHRASGRTLEEAINAVWSEAEVQS